MKKIGNTEMLEEYNYITQMSTLYFQYISYLVFCMNICIQSVLRTCMFHIHEVNHWGSNIWKKKFQKVPESRTRICPALSTVLSPCE